MRIKVMELGFLSTNTYICFVGDKAFIIDPAKDAPEIIRALDGATPVAILLTHGHFDHLLAVNDLREKYPEIKVYAHPADGDTMLHPGRGIIAREYTDAAVTDFTPISDGEKLCIEGVTIEVISTPGHSKGSVCYYIEDPRVLFVGDLIFYESYGKTEFPGGDHDEIYDSIVNKIFARFKDTGHLDILTGHLEPTTLEHELKYNPIWTN